MSKINPLTGSALEADYDSAEEDADIAEEMKEERERAKKRRKEAKALGLISDDDTSSSSSDDEDGPVRLSGHFNQDARYTGGSIKPKKEKKTKKDKKEKKSKKVRDQMHAFFIETNLCRPKQSPPHQNIVTPG